jgi:oligopeptide/dipeptide ABC transporter ATP-binding protein
MTNVPVLAVDALTKDFAVTERQGFRRVHSSIRAVDDVSFTLNPGEVLGLVGESGCGKTTLARMLMQLETPSCGEIRLGARPLVNNADRSALQMIFQDPYASVNPRMTVAQIIEEPLVLRRPDLDARQRREIAQLRLEEVSMGETHMSRRASELSGGQLQRIGIARALTLDPKVLICDEPVSALDVSIQAQVLDLLASIRATRGLSMVFISHDLSVIRQVCDRVAVMYLGRIIEEGPARRVLSRPAHPYTKALVSSEPRIRRKGELDQRIILKGEPPSPASRSAACVFRQRCWKVRSPCDAQPPFEPVVEGHLCACHFPDEGAVSDK